MIMMMIYVYNICVRYNYGYYCCYDVQIRILPQTVTHQQ